MPNDRWDDFAIDTQKAADERRFVALENLATSLSELPYRVGQIKLEQEHQGERLAGFKTYIADVEERLREEIKHARDDSHEGISRVASQCEAIQTSLEADASRREQREITVQTASKQRRTTLVVAFVAGGFTLVAAVLALVGTIVGAK